MQDGALYVDDMMGDASEFLRIVTQAFGPGNNNPTLDVRVTTCMDMLRFSMHAVQDYEIINYITNYMTQLPQDGPLVRFPRVSVEHCPNQYNYRTVVFEMHLSKESRLWEGLRCFLHSRCSYDPNARDRPGVPLYDLINDFLTPASWGKYN
jgi:hypothetical protein